MQERAHSAGLKLVRIIDPEIGLLWADKRAVKQILINLLGNAVKFTPQGGQVTLAARSAPDRMIELSVADTGIGIPAEHLATALAAFGQVDNPMTAPSKAPAWACRSSSRWSRCMAAASASRAKSAKALASAPCCPP